jgi:hypothetical protein
MLSMADKCGKITTNQTRPNAPEKRGELEQITGGNGVAYPFQQVGGQHIEWLPEEKVRITGITQAIREKSSPRKRSRRWRV